MRIQQFLTTWNFLYTCSDTFAVGCIVSHKHNVTHRQTDGRTDWR